MSIDNRFSLTDAFAGIGLATVLLCFYSEFVAAQSTGIRVNIEENEIDWEFDDKSREARITRLSFEIEECLDSGTRLGFGLGYTDIDLRGDGRNASKRFTGEHLELFVRHPFAVTDDVSLLTRVNYRYNSGSDDDDESSADIDWSELGIELGLAIRFSNVRVTPFARYQYLDGDLSGDPAGGSFDLDNPASAGIKVDLFTEPTAYVRLSLRGGDYSTVFLTFAREY